MNGHVLVSHYNNFYMGIIIKRTFQKIKQKMWVGIECMSEARIEDYKKITSILETDYHMWIKPIGYPQP